MFKHNQYFDGSVSSLGFETPEGPATVGVMAPGAYTFGTSTREVMTVITGTLTIQQPGETEWTAYGPGESFEVPGGITFGVRVETNTAYLCRYDA
ncbi:MAG: pyrimidine/purine nucleoside phosphorylase [Verrucomicrobia bacterium]|nr:pyrimidine/purine nucleoside phosphorylase [Verrucomicrobiota bacterium]MCH8528214.1 pyrimidine/purine nucleoside phosphorylase [Kiritimatiellia bacterium]